MSPVPMSTVLTAIPARATHSQRQVSPAGARSTRAVESCTLATIGTRPATAPSPCSVMPLTTSPRTGPIRSQNLTVPP